MAESAHFNIQTKYDDQEPLYFADYIVYGISEESPYRLKIDLNHDSLIQIIKLGLDQLPIKIINIPQKRNYDNLSYFHQPYLSYSTINKNLIFKSAASFPDKTIIFPVLSMYYKRRGNHDVSKPVYWFTCEVTLAFFVVKNRDVLYYKQVRHKEIVKDKDHTHAYEDFFIPISTSTWGEMVRNVMKEYYSTY